MLTPRFLGWTAGFLEGEGHFYLARNRHNGASPRVVVSQVQREPLDRLKRYFGGYIYWHPHKGKGIHQWHVSGPTAIGVMMTVYAMMSVKYRAQIRPVIDAWRKRPGISAANRAKTTCPQGHPYDVTLQFISDGKTRTVRGCRECRNEAARRFRRAHPGRGARAHPEAGA